MTTSDPRSSTEVEVLLPAASATSYTAGQEGPAKSAPSPVTHVELDPEAHLKALEAEIEAEDQGPQAEPQNKDGEDKPPGAAEEQQPEQEGEAEQQGDAPAWAALPEEFDPANAEVVAKFDEVYFEPPAEEGGQARFKTELVGEQFWANWAKAREGLEDAGSLPPDHGHLPEATYKYLETSFGLDRTAITEIEQSLVAKAMVTASAQDAHIYEVAGGAEPFNAAIEWARGGGYTEDQRNRFNAALKKGGEDADDAILALMTRHSKAGGGAAPGAAPSGPPAAASPSRVPGAVGRRRASTPARDPAGTSGAPAAGAGGGGSADTFDTQQAYQEATADIRKRTKAATTAAEKRALEAEYQAIRAKGLRSVARWRNPGGR